MALPPDITPEHIHKAIAQLADGVSHQFGPSTRYDLVVDDKRYPPKAVVGLAASLVTGRDYGPDGFSGGEGEQQANGLLRRLGFRVELKGDAATSDVPGWARDGEGARRWDAWLALGHPAPDQRIQPQALRSTTLYGGAQGIFVDRKRTASAEFPEGVAVSVLHTGVHYPDELSDDGIVYHYPETKRPASRDANEVSALKNAGQAGVPVLVITRPAPSSSSRHARWGWVADADDRCSQVYIAFGERPNIQLVEPPFNPTAAKSTKKALVPTRPGQAKFRFDVLKRYGPLCALCDLDILRLLEAAHIFPKEYGGTDDPRNGLVLCRNHHKAFDEGLVLVQPGTLRVVLKGEYSREQLQVTRESLKHLPELPADEAVELSFQRSSADG